MAADYTAGSASSWADLLTAIEAFLTTIAGWSVTAGTGTNRIFSKGTLVARLGTTATSIYAFGATGIAGTATTGDSQAWVASKMGSPTPAPVTFPISYEIYWNDTPEEIYIVINYNGDKYQDLQFGKSDIPGIGGTGMWVGGSYRNDQDLTTSQAHYMFMGSSAFSGGSGDLNVTNYAGLSGGYFAVGGGTSSWICGGIHCGLEGADAWRYNDNPVGGLYGQEHNGALMQVLPNALNEAEILLPIYHVMRRVDNVYTIVGVLRHARHLRIDNTAPGDIITFGGDQWKVYPLYAKNTAARNGAAWTSGTAQHSGTFGVALRYPGP
jgi:hypothetical protein